MVVVGPKEVPVLLQTESTLREIALGQISHSLLKSSSIVKQVVVAMVDLPQMSMPMPKLMEFRNKVVKITLQRTHSISNVLIFKNAKIVPHRKGENLEMWEFAGHSLAILFGR